MDDINYESIYKLIENNRDKVNFAPFGEGIQDEWIDRAQSRLGVRFPPSYIWWLKNYKGGEINGNEIFGIYELDFDTVIGGDIVYMNELDRKDGLVVPEQLVIQHGDEGEDYYFDLKDMDDSGESPVLLRPSKERYANDFLEFLNRKILE